MLLVAVQSGQHATEREGLVAHITCVICIECSSTSVTTLFNSNECDPFIPSFIHRPRCRQRHKLREPHIPPFFPSRARSEPLLLLVCGLVPSGLCAGGKALTRHILATFGLRIIVSFHNF